MGWSLGYDDNWKRDIGYGVPAFCDHPGCGKKIDRGLAHVCCDQEPYGGDNGCGLYFCSDHQRYDGKCKRCATGKPPFKPTPDHPDWMRHKLADESWQQWRDENPEDVEKIKAALKEQGPTEGRSPNPS